MILADTSIWIDFFRRGSERFAEYLEEGQIALHSVVIGELATANLKLRSETLASLRRLPRAREGQEDDCRQYLEMHRLYGRGLGWSDIQLLVAAHLSDLQIRSLDQPLVRAAAKFNLQYCSA